MVLRMHLPACTLLHSLLSSLHALLNALCKLILLHQTPKLIFLTVNTQLPSSTRPQVVTPALHFYPRYINVHHLYCVSRGDRTQSLAELRQPHFKRQNLEKGSETSLLKAAASQPGRQQTCTERSGASRSSC